MLKRQKTRLKNKWPHFEVVCKNQPVKQREAATVERKPEQCGLLIPMLLEQQRRMRLIRCREHWAFVQGIKRGMHLTGIYKKS